jgi:hypothetical protein
VSDTPKNRDADDSMTQRLMALETSVHRLRLALYGGLAIVLIAGVLGAEWLFKQSVRQVDEAAGSIQIQFDQRAKASRLNIEREFREVHGQLKALAGKSSPDETGANDVEAARGLDR